MKFNNAILIEFVPQTSPTATVARQRVAGQFRICLHFRTASCIYSHPSLSCFFPLLCLDTTSHGQWTRIPPSRSTSCPSASCHKDMRSLTMPLTRNPRHRPRCRHRLLRKCTVRPPTIIALATTWPTMAAMAIWCTGVTTIGATWCCRLSHYRTTTRKAWATWCAAWIQISSTRPQCNPGKCRSILIPDMAKLASLTCHAAATSSIIAAQLVASA